MAAAEGGIPMIPHFPDQYGATLPPLCWCCPVHDDCQHGGTFGRASDLARANCVRMMAAGVEL